MAKVKNTTMIIIGVVGFIAVAAGGFGEHVLGPKMTPEMKYAWGLAVQFNLVHAVAMMAVFAAMKSLDPDSSAARRLNRAFHLLLLGTSLFAGSIYAMGLGAPGKTVGPLTPVGGVTLMSGWLTVALAGF
ncbi:uncharacterized protein Tco025E_09239 [Trypanosoma conorhini]|uniref:Membrane protein n=1 Tax=Trypanosoma conorhini TaxID=83891 RepID=A0A422N1G8_9TRYP|nr:uncharacterized protein Tco025E_09239 [Trypanosoma conorhini]RNE99316.1 membrane protein [Trypanosoma conorhini]